MLMVVSNRYCTYEIIDRGLFIFFSPARSTLQFIFRTFFRLISRCIRSFHATFKTDTWRSFTTRRKQIAALSSLSPRIHITTRYLSTLRFYVYTHAAACFFTLCVPFVRLLPVATISINGQRFRGKWILFVRFEYARE